MSRSTLIALGAAAAAVSAVALPVTLGAAGASTACVAHGTLPSRVVLGPSATTVRSTLVGTAGCRPGSYDNGGTAVLDVPDTSVNDPLQWSKLGASDSVRLSAGLDAPGVYRLRDGQVQVYNSQEERIPSSWRETTVTAKYAGRFADVRRSGGQLRATLDYYAKTRWTAHHGTTVTLQKRSGSAWRDVVSEKSDGTGRVAFTVGGGSYRLVSASTRYVWSATS